MADIRLEGITKVFSSGFCAIRSLDLEVADGEFLVLVGPSGCSKTTLLRTIAGLEDVTNGRIEIGGKDVTDAPPRRRDVAMVFQNYALYPHMNVRKNLGYGLKVRRTPRPRLARRVEEVAGAARAGASCSTASGAALRRPAPARRDGPRHRARAAGFPDGRAALEPRREAPRRHSRLALRAPSAPRRHDRLRHARPDRGDDARPAGGGDARGPDPPGRQAAEALRGARRTSSSPRSSARRR